MQIVVCIKVVPDAEGPITVDTSSNDIRRDWLSHGLNPCDSLGLEEAIRIKERCGGSVTALSIGSPSTVPLLRTCLARGADRVILISDPALDGSDSYTTGVILARAIGALGLSYDLVLCGARAVDTNCGLAGPTMAQILSIPLVTEVVKTRVDGVETAVVEKKLEGGKRAVVETPLPALLTIEAGINKPRFLKLPALLSASKTAIEEYNLGDLGMLPEEVGIQGSKTRIAGIAPPRPRGKKLFTPDSNLSPAERMRLLMSGGVTQKASSGMLKGNPKTVASQFVSYLRQNELLPREFRDS